MEREERLLQLLRREFTRFLPWFESKTGSTITISGIGPGNAFSMTAMWDGGSYTYTYNTVVAQSLGGRGGCPARMAERFIDNVRITKARNGNTT